MATQLNDWLTVDKNSGTGNAEITLTASSYEEFVDRATSLKIQGISANAILNVRQNAMIPTITLSNNHFNFDYNGGKYLDTTITSNVDWTVKSSDNWFYVSHDYGTKGETVFRVEVTENEGNKREGTITFSYNGEVLATLFITQYGLVSFANDIMTFGHLAETQQNEVLINTSWYIVKDSEWFTVVPSNGSDASNITVSVEENDGLRRTGKISLFSTDGDFFLGEIIVRQKSEFDSQYMWVETAENAGISAYPAIDYSFDCLTWNRATYFSMDGHNIVYVRKGEEIKYIRRNNHYYVYSSSKFSVGGNPISFGTTLINFFSNRTTLVDASELDISGVTVGYGMFSGCTNLKYSPKMLPSENFNNFGYMFQDCKNLITAPELPATSLPGYYKHYETTGTTGGYKDFGGCYEYMFKGCTSLTTAPALPATELGEFCYAYMFYGCTSLIEAPQLPATTMKEGCYTRMFVDCTSLTSAPALPALNLSHTMTTRVSPNGCYYGMFENCTSLRTAPELPATVLEESCYGTMFQGCANLRTAPALPATVLAGGCYNAMFKYCASLTTAPELPAPVLVESCYEGMFMYCEKLNYIKMLATDISANRCLYNWVYYVAPTGTFVKTAGANIPIDSNSGIPYGWTVQEEALVPTIILSNRHFFFDYNGGKYLETVIISNVDWRVSSSDNWFYVSHDYGTKGETVFKVEVTENEGYKRDGTITFSYNGEVLATLFITQYGLVSFVNDTMSFGYLAEAQENEVLIDSPWYLIKDGDWFTVTPTNGSNVSNITVSVNQNDGARRVGSISLYTTDGDFYLGSITVKQASEFDSQYLWLETIDTDKYVRTGQRSIKFSFDGVNWSNGNNINMNGNKIIYMYSDTPTDDLDLTHSDLGLYLYQISYGGKHSVGGNAAAIGKNVVGLFEDNVNLVDASELNISEIKKAPYMFSGCNNLKYPPKTLPTTITNDFNHMFSNCTSLLEAPALPALELYNYKTYNGSACLYGSMFLNCTSLTTAPELPATVLGEGCYNNMFYGCTSLTTAPQLPATVLKQSCYAGMFDKCTSLTTAPQLPATTLARACYKLMFSECSSLVTAPQLPATTLVWECYNGMFYNCGSLVNPPQLLATTLADSCCNAMFYSCENLTTAPTLKAAKLETRCYASMFKFCSKLNYIKMLAYDGLENTYGLDDWVDGVPSEGTFVKHPDADLPRGISGIPSNWTVETATE